jgi:signal transduction histidine kinase
MQNERRFALLLFCAFATIGLAFVASTAYSNWLSFEIDGEAQALTGNALPSVQHLTAAIDALRDLEAATDDYADVQPEDRLPARLRISSLSRLVEAELGTYRALPAFPGEREAYDAVPAALADLDAAVVRLYADAESGDRERARRTADREVRPKANRTSSLLREIVRFDGAHAAESSLRIQATRRKVAVIASILDATTLLFTGAVAFFIWRIFRSNSRLQRDHARLVEQRADELEVFGRRVAHDLLSPLSSLDFCLSAFKGVSEGDSKLENALVRARQCVVRAQGLVENIFDFARSGGAPAKDARVEVHDVVDQIVEEARAGDPNERPEIEVGPLPDCAVRCTRGVLVSILGNLVRNSVKFMRDSSVRRIEIRGVEAGGVLQVEVEDTGPGIPLGLEQSIFEPYVRGQGVTQPGLGLGLATVKRFCEAHGGTVGVRPTTSGRGSVFYFTLPKAPAAPYRALSTATRGKLGRVASS